MSDDSLEQNKPEGGNSVDLSSLNDLSFGPSWTEAALSTSQKKSRKQSDSGKGFSGSKDSSGPRRDRRRGGKPERSQKFQKRAEFTPIVDVQIYPDDAAFDKLAKSIRKSCKTYELFEVARVILEKPERYVAVLSNLKDKEGKSDPLYVSAVDGLPFRTEDQAINHVLKAHVAELFELEEVEVESPKGNFTFVQKCPVTGDLIGPPNYHRFPSLLKDHHAAKASHIPFDRYQNQLEKVTEEDQVQQWVESMSKQIRYRPKEDAAAEPLEGLDAVRYYILSKGKAKIVKEQASVRLSGQEIAKIQDRDLVRSVEAFREKQLKFPLDVANNLRARFRRMKFNIYKKGSKGISYVCAVKRKFRDPSTTFSESPQKLMAFLDENQNISTREIAPKYLGIEMPSPAPGEEAAPLSPEVDAQLKQLMQDLNWLIHEGYVTEYGNGTLFAPPPMKQVQSKPAEATADANEAPAAPLVSEPAPIAAEPEAEKTAE